MSALMSFSASSGSGASDSTRPSDRAAGLAGVAGPAEPEGFASAFLPGGEKSARSISLELKLPRTSIGFLPGLTDRSPVSVVLPAVSSSLVRSYFASAPVTWLASLYGPMGGSSVLASTPSVASDWPSAETSRFSPSPVIGFWIVPLALIVAPPASTVRSTGHGAAPVADNDASGPSMPRILIGWLL